MVRQSDSGETLTYPVGGRTPFLPATGLLQTIADFFKEGSRDVKRRLLNLPNGHAALLLRGQTVHLNPLGVLLSVLVGVELAGFVGALLAIPVAGAIQVVVRDLWDDRQQRPKAVPTVGADETPIAGLGAE